MTDIFIKLKEAISKEHKYAVYAKPGETTLTAVFQTHNNTQQEPDSKKGFIFAPFSGGETVFIPYQSADVITASIPDFSYTNTNVSNSIPTDNGKEAFENLVAKCVAVIKEGRFDKLVTSRKESIQLNDIEPIDIFKRLLTTYPNAFRYCFYSKETGLWMGATPEQLLKIEHNTLHTVALAGTRLNSIEPTTQWPEKEQQEQQFVTDYIVNQLVPFTVTTTKTAPYTATAGNLQHIKTDISALIAPDINTLHIINTLHPTPAVCGLPKQEALNYLIEKEGYNREYYAGYLGELNHDFADNQPKTDLFVNLRCMKIEGKTAHLYIGCGITANSIPENEYQETVNKSMTMKKLF
ncbi:MAG: chorismate-binding protein [Bacteroidota bacterium]